MSGITHRGRENKTSSLDEMFLKMKEGMQERARVAREEAERAGLLVEHLDTSDEDWPDSPKVEHFKLGISNRRLTAEVRLPCNRCDENGFSRDYATDERGYTYAVRCRCWEWRRRALLLTGKSGLPPRASMHTLDKLNWGDLNGRLVVHGQEWGGSAVVQREVNRVRLSASRRPLRTGLLLFGDTGIGKSHITQALVTSTILEGGEKATWHHWPSWLTRFKAAFNKNSVESTDQVIDSLSKGRVIALEELGGERITDFARAQLDEVLTMLGDNGHTLIVTTNHSSEELVDQIGARSVSRLLELCEVVEVEGRRGDYRAQAGDL